MKHGGDVHVDGEARGAGVIATLGLCEYRCEWHMLLHSSSISIMCFIPFPLFLLCPPEAVSVMPSSINQSCVFAADSSLEASAAARLSIRTSDSARPHRA